MVSQGGAGQSHIVVKTPEQDRVCTASGFVDFPRLFKKSQGAFIFPEGVAGGGGVHVGGACGECFPEIHIFDKRKRLIDMLHGFFTVVGLAVMSDQLIVKHELPAQILSELCLFHPVEKMALRSCVIAFCHIFIHLLNDSLLGNGLYLRRLSVGIPAEDAARFHIILRANAVMIIAHLYFSLICVYMRPESAFAFSLHLYYAFYRLPSRTSSTSIGGT